jgi:hypothetical protein
MTEIQAGDLGRLLDLGRLDLLVGQHEKEIAGLRKGGHDVAGAVQRIDGAVTAKVEAQGQEIERLRERWREHNEKIASNDARNLAMVTALTERSRETADRVAKLEILTHITPRVDKLEEAVEKLTAVMLGEGAAQDGGMNARLGQLQTGQAEVQQALVRARWLGALVIVAVVSEIVRTAFTLLRPHP